jgi:N6-L-threonylcarbamoyladenine synthase
MDGRILCSERTLLPVENGKRGLRQSEAVFAHVRQLPKAMEKLEARGKDRRICAVAVSAGPRDGRESYMPVFLVGLGFARAMASAFSIPCYTFSHQQGHIAAGQIGNAAMGGIFVALHLSGGTTEMMLCNQGALHPLGGTLDLYAGQLVDRVGVALGLPFPAGPALEKLAAGCKETSEALLPASLVDDDLHCHLSGAETKCLKWIESGELSPERIALEVFDFLARVVVRLLAAGCRKGQVQQALVVGGVAASSLLRRLMAERMAKRAMGNEIQVVFGSPEYSADNAAGIAWLGARRHCAILNKREGEQENDGKAFGWKNHSPGRGNPSEGACGRA